MYPDPDSLASENSDQMIRFNLFRFLSGKKVQFHLSRKNHRKFHSNGKRSRRKRKGEKKFQNFDFWACPSGNALKRDAGGKKGNLLCCKRIFDHIEGSLAEIQPKNHQNVQKTHLLQKVPGVNGLS